MISCISTDYMKGIASHFKEPRLVVASAIALFILATGFFLTQYYPPKSILCGVGISLILPATVGLYEIFNRCMGNKRNSSPKLEFVSSVNHTQEIPEHILVTTKGKRFLLPTSTAFEHVDIATPSMQEGIRSGDVLRYIEHGLKERQKCAAL